MDVQNLHFSVWIMRWRVETLWEGYTCTIGLLTVMCIVTLLANEHYVKMVHYSNKTFAVCCCRSSIWAWLVGWQWKTPQGVSCLHCSAICWQCSSTSKATATSMHSRSCCWKMSLTVRLQHYELTLSSRFVMLKCLQPVYCFWKSIQYMCRQILYSVLYYVWSNVMAYCS